VPDSTAPGFIQPSFNVPAGRRWCIPSSTMSFQRQRLPDRAARRDHDRRLQLRRHRDAVGARRRALIPALYKVV
jgi:hypothetical protein